MELDRSTILVDPMKEINGKLLPKLKISLHTQALSNHHIKDVLGHNRLSPPINTKDLETN